MNATVSTATVAEAAPITEAAPVSVVMIPLCDLTRSKRNVRKAATLTIPQLAASILAHGLMHNLTVTRGKAGKYEVVAGGRRLDALTELRRAKKIEKTHPVPCRIVDVSEARELSLAENVAREPMAPVDEYEAYAGIIAKDGKSAQDVADRFGVSLQHVMRRLKLGRLSPRLLDEYRAGKIEGKQLEALTLSDSHAAQERAWFDAPTVHHRFPGHLRAVLTHEQIDAANDVHAQFVGAAAYEAAGGRINRDLFAASNDAPGFWLDADILARCVAERLRIEAEQVKAEGWAWVEMQPLKDSGWLAGFRRFYPTQRERTEAEAEEFEALDKEFDDLAALPTLDEAQDARADAISLRMEALDEALNVWAPEVLAKGGALVTVSPSASLEIHRGLMRPEDVQAPKKAKADAQARTSRDEGREEGGDEEGEVRAAQQPEAPTQKPLSDALTADLTAHRTAALAAVLMDRPDIALVAVVHKLMVSVFYGYGGDSALEITVRPVTTLHKDAPGIEASPSHMALSDRFGWWQLRIPATSDEAWGWLLERDQETLLSLLAYCAARTVNAVKYKDVFHDSVGRITACNDIASAVRLNMADWWEPTVGGYLGRVSKDQILDAVREGVGADAAANIMGLKKTPLAEQAERRLRGSRWVPHILRKMHDEADEQDGAAQTQEGQGGEAEAGADAPEGEGVARTFEAATE